MKKMILILGGLALLTVGCNKVGTVETPAEETTMESPRQLTVDITVNKEGDTRSVKTGWEEGDKVYVFFDHFFLDYLTDPEIGTSGFSDDVQYLTLTYNGNSWQSEFSDEALVKYLRSQSSGSLVAVYYSDLVPEFRAIHGKRGAKEEFYIEVKNGTNQLGFYLFDQECSYSVADGKLTASLNMHLHEKSVLFYVSGLSLTPGGYYHTLKSEQIGNNELTSIASTNMNDEGFAAPLISTAVSTANKPIYATYRPEGAFFNGRISSSDYIGAYTDYVITITDNMTSPTTTDDVVYAYSRRAKLFGKDAIELLPLDNPIWVKRLPSSETGGYLNGHRWVRMGDGRKWAVDNVGAGNGNDAGTLMTWDEAAAYSEWGDGWRLPTMDEWDALFEATNHQPRRYYDIDGNFAGIRMTYGNDPETFVVSMLYLPVTGRIDLWTNTHYEQNEGYYWSSTPVEEDDPYYQEGYYFVAQAIEGNPVNIYGDVYTGSRIPHTMHKLAVRLIIDE